MKSSWNYKPISEIMDVLTDYVANGSFASLKENVAYSDSGFARVIRLTDYNHDFSDDGIYVSEAAYNFLSKTKLFGNEIIIANVGANVGKIFMSPNLNEPMTLGPNSILLKTKFVDSFYYYYFKSPEGQNRIQSIVTGSAQPKFNKTSFKKLIVPVPDIKEQLDIAKKLNIFDEKIKILKQINDNLHDLLHEKFRKMILESSDEFITLEKLSPSIIAGDWGKETADDVNNASVMIIRGADIPSISSGGKGQAPERYIKQAARDKKHLKPADVIVEISGGSPTQSTGRTLFVSDELLQRFSATVVGTNFTKTLRFTIFDQAVFAYFYLEYFYQAGLFFNYENGTTGIKNLDYKSVLKIPVRNLLNSDSFEQFVQLFSIIERTRQTNGATIENLTKTRDTLLAKLIN